VLSDVIRWHEAVKRHNVVVDGNYLDISIATVYICIVVLRMTGDVQMMSACVAVVWFSK
jgi:hypothetical protein